MEIFKIIAPFWSEKINNRPRLLFKKIGALHSFFYKNVPFYKNVQAEVILTKILKTYPGCKSVKERLYFAAPTTHERFLVIHRKIW